MTKPKPNKPRQPPAVWLSRDRQPVNRLARYGIHRTEPQYLCGIFSQAERYFCPEEFHAMTYFYLRPGTQAKVRIWVERVR